MLLNYVEKNLCREKNNKYVERSLDQKGDHTSKRNCMWPVGRAMWPKEDLRIKV